MQAGKALARQGLGEVGRKQVLTVGFLESGKQISVESFPIEAETLLF